MYIQNIRIFYQRFARISRCNRTEYTPRTEYTRVFCPRIVYTPGIICLRTEASGSTRTLSKSYLFWSSRTHFGQVVPILVSHTHSYFYAPPQSGRHIVIALSCLSVRSFVHPFVRPVSCLSHNFCIIKWI